MKKHLILTLCGLSVAADLYATSTNNGDWKREDWDSGYLYPFAEDQGFTNEDILGEGFSFPTWDNNRMCAITWKESEYDGSRREKGHEIKGQVTSNWKVYSGWQWYFPGNSTNNMVGKGKDTILWQMYCWNSAGCSNWTAHMTMEDNDLRFDYRASCNDATRHTIKSNVSKNTWYDVACALRTGNGNGLFQCKFGDNTVDLSLNNINIGFGDKNSNGSMQDAVIGVKMGIYAFDDDGYSNNEKRWLRLDKLSVADRDAGASASTTWNRVEPWEW